MKHLSISISGSGTVSDDLAEKVQALGEELKPIAGLYVTIGVSDAPPEPAPGAGTQAP